MTESKRTLLQLLSHLEQIDRNIRPAHVECEPVDDTAPFNNGAAWLPERTALERAGFDRSDCESECAPPWLGLTHVFSFETAGANGIRASPDWRCGLLRNGASGSNSLPKDVLALFEYQLILTSRRSILGRCRAVSRQRVRWL
jgi:hypothetical protein